MLWPMRSPALHVQPGRRSQSSTPLMGPAGSGMLAKVSEHAVVDECEDFMLPPTPQAPNSSPTKQVPSTPESFPVPWPDWQAYGQVPPWQQMWIMRNDPAWSNWPQASSYPMPMGGFGGGANFGWLPMENAGMWLPPESEMEQLAGPWLQLPETPSWSLIWVGERAIRASAAGSPLTKGADGFGEKAEKEQLEQLGFTVKLYRNHERCSRALEKKC
ncbi:unnamed protein product, partial [Effrenium voratum]